MLVRKLYGLFVYPLVRFPFILLVWLITALGIVYAVDIPPIGAEASLQTTGPNAPINIGDYYTSVNGGTLNGEDTDHILEINIPCAWPANLPVTFALFDPETTGGIFAGPPFARDEQRGGADDNTVFTLTAPGGAVVAPPPYTPAGGSNGLWVELVTVTPDTPSFGCGTYVLRTSVANDDDNGWRLRVNHDPDCTVSDSGPGTCTGIGAAISTLLDDGDEQDDADGTPGTADELVVDVIQGSFEHATTSCQEFFFFVDAVPTTVTFNNFDMDANVDTSVTYFPPAGSVYAPSQPGSASLGSRWNNGVPGTPGVSAPARVGDEFDIGPTDIGWWRAEVCVNSDNQYIFEGEQDEPIYFEQPGTPLMTISKDNGVSVVAPNQVLTYTINFANIADTVTPPPPPGAALNVIITDNLPANTTFQNCVINPPFSGSCLEGPTGVVTAQINEIVAAGEGGSLQIVVQVNANAGGTLSNSVSLDYQDTLGNQYPPATAEDIDLIPPDLTLAKTDGGVTTSAGSTVVYTLTYTNSSATGATGVVITETIPANTTFNAGASAPTIWNCPDGSGPGTACVTDLGPVPGGSGGSVNFALRLDTPLPAGVTEIANTATIGDDGANGPDPTPNNSATDTTPIVSEPVIIDPLITKAADLSEARPGDAVNFFITISNPGPPSNAAATNVTLVDALPLELDLVNHSVSSNPAGIVGSTTVTTDVILLSGHPSGITQTVASTVTVAVPALGVNEVVTLSVTARVNSLANPLPATVVNVATLNFSEGGPRTDDVVVTVPASSQEPSPPQSTDDDDDDDDTPAPTSPSASQPSTPAQPTPTPEPPVPPVSFLPETGMKDVFDNGNGFGALGLLGLALVGSILMRLYARRK